MLASQLDINGVLVGGQQNKRSREGTETLWAKEFFLSERLPGLVR